VKKSITLHIQKQRVRFFSSKRKTEINAEYKHGNKKKLYTEPHQRFGSHITTEVVVAVAVVVEVKGCFELPNENEVFA
jgi:hypothetical protein